MPSTAPVVADQPLSLVNVGKSSSDTSCYFLHNLVRTACLSDKSLDNFHVCSLWHAMLCWIPLFTGAPGDSTLSEALKSLGTPAGQQITPDVGSSEATRVIERLVITNQLKAQWNKARGKKTYVYMVLRVRECITFHTTGFGIRVMQNVTYGFCCRGSPIILTNLIEYSKKQREFYQDDLSSTISWSATKLPFPGKNIAEISTARSSTQAKLCCVRRHWREKTSPLCLFNHATTTELSNINTRGCLISSFEKK